MNGKLFFFIAGLSALCWEGNVAAGQIYQFTTIAGLAGASGSVDGTNSEARFKWPTSLTVDKSGNIYTTDGDGSTIRKITRAGTNWVVSTIAGLPGAYGSADGTNSEARFYLPDAVTIDKNGVLYVGEYGNSTIRKITLLGTNWTVSTIAGTAGSFGSVDGTNSAACFGASGAALSGIACNGQSQIFASDFGNSTIRKVTPVGTDWVVATIAGAAGHYGSADGFGSDARFFRPVGIATDSRSGVYVADLDNHTIRKLTPEGMNWAVSTIGGVALDYGSEDGITGIARFNSPSGVAVDADDNLYIADFGNHTIRMGAPLTLSIVQVDNRTIQGTWRTLPGRTYEVQYTSDLRTAAWSPLGSRIATSGTALNFSDTLGGEAQRFYRIVLIP